MNMQAIDLTTRLFSLNTVPPSTTVKRFDNRLAGIASETTAAGTASALRCRKSLIIQKPPAIIIRNHCFFANDATRLYLFMAIIKTNCIMKINIAKKNICVMASVSNNTTLFITGQKLHKTRVASTIRKYLAGRAVKGLKKFFISLSVTI